MLFQKVVSMITRKHLTVLTTADYEEKCSRSYLYQTSRERPKSAPYLRLKNSKRTSKCQSILFYGTGKTQTLNRIGAPEGKLWDFLSILSQIIKKIEGGALLVKEIFWKVSQCRKNKGGTLWDFSTSVLSENSKKLKERPFGGIFFSKKSLTEPKIH